MYYIIFTVLVFAKISAAIPVQNLNAEAEAKGNKILECFRDILLNGDEELSLPPLDPSPPMDTVIDVPGANGSILLKNFQTEGISAWKTTLKVDLMNNPEVAIVKVGFLWPAGVMEADYDIDINYMNNVITGKGHLKRTDFNQVIDMELEVAFDTVKLKKFYIRFSLEKIQIDVDEILLNGVDVSSIISSVAQKIPDILKMYEKELSSYFSEKILESFNSIDQKNINSILDFVKRRCNV
ncbi:PREDICTED: uncharacterized protein LOC108563671 [Nicrophorus vespilloides]|uniref:Uncharacterized protein LOC108563671 n=1 Tax=Nicrophorus vespilloides TaxID=110193 RepID=A0ABM1MTJ7_NICVS|nr:PREDICTED: uncharacterized protein LOC108563671 [Nicrophorus vespilloides]